MKRKTYDTPCDWFTYAKEEGLAFPSLDEMRCTPNAFLAISTQEQQKLAQAAKELSTLMRKATEDVIHKKRFNEFLIPSEYHHYLEQSFSSDQPTLFGRFDFSFDREGTPKLLEYNADTPALYVESSVLQRRWKERLFPGATDWNELEERTLSRLKEMDLEKIHITAVDGLMYDQMQTRYLTQVAKRAEISATHFPLEELHFRESQNIFTDGSDQPIAALYKMYPWEWLIADDTQRVIPKAHTRWIEPIYRMIPSSKRMLALLWETHPEHPNLLPTYTEPEPLGESFAQKPFYSHRGEGVSLQTKKQRLSVPSPEESSHYVYQKLCPLPKFQKWYACVGVWMVGNTPAGIGVRESRGPVTDSLSYFLPHLISEEAA